MGQRPETLEQRYAPFRRFFFLHFVNEKKKCEDEDDDDDEHFGSVAITNFVLVFNFVFGVDRPDHVRPPTSNTTSIGVGSDRCRVRKVIAHLDTDSGPTPTLGGSGWGQGGVPPNPGVRVGVRVGCPPNPGGVSPQPWGRVGGSGGVSPQPGWGSPPTLGGSPPTLGAGWGV